MNVPEELRKLIVGLGRDISEIDRSIHELELRRSELLDERKRLMRGVEEISREIYLMEGD